MQANRLLAWFALVTVSAGAAILLATAAVPAPWLIAPLIVAIVASAGGLVDLRMPPAIFVGAQATIGTLIAQTFTVPVVASIARSWAVMAVVVATTIVAAAIAGWILARFSSIPAATAAWGSSPGGASAMVAMSVDYGADARIVAFMQYLRVTIVVLSASAVSRILLPHVVSRPAPVASAFDMVAVLETALVAVAGVWAAARLRIPAGSLLGPMVLGAGLHGTGLVHITVPTLVLDAAYLAIVSRSGCFTRGPRCSTPHGCCRSSWSRRSC